VAGHYKMGDEVKVVVWGSKESGGNCFNRRQAFMHWTNKFWGWKAHAQSWCATSVWRH